MYYRPIAAHVPEPKLTAVFTAIWWIIPLTFALAGLALIYSGTVSYQATTALLAGAQFLASAPRVSHSVAKDAKTFCSGPMGPVSRDKRCSAPSELEVSEAVLR
jgi:hypothetical protein